MASTLAEVDSVSADELTLICLITEGKCDAALRLLARAESAARTKGAALAESRQYA
jgi:hypothetical protein